ncbi:hypothetical protein GCM10009716_27750 [Streptomyces sodiiphilus]|uniref:Fatty acid--CoA ligase n=1 Tax=Streptomyces sodiiphilus TaxID=226217 RepID=A0ABN2PE85_9ACTN
MPSRSFVDAFDAQVRARPAAPALSWGEEVVGYGGLDRLARRAHRSLAALAIPDGVPVCVPARKSPETVALLLACFRAGRRVLVPASGLGAQALSAVCAASGCTHVLEASGAAVRGSPVDPAPARPADLPPGPGLLLTTSGSTGTPKTVVLSDEGTDRFRSWAAPAFGIGPGTGVLNYAPLNFDLCLLDVWTSLAAGACVHLVDSGRAADGPHLVRLCAERAPRVLQAVPLFFRLLDRAAAPGQTFPGAREILVTGEAAPPALLARVSAMFPGARMWNVYGCTETNDSFLHEVTPEEIRGPGPVPIGRPVDGVRARVVDGDGRVLSGACAGELVVATPFQAKGYTDPELTGDKWDGQWFRTGDLVRRDEHGLVFLTGRNDHQVKVRGVRTNLQEVEQVVLSHPQVMEAAVIAVPDEAAGTVLHSVVRRTPGSGMNGLRLRVHCASRLPRTAIPGVIEITDEELPRTPTGKVDRAALGRPRVPEGRPGAAMTTR